MNHSSTESVLRNDEEYAELPSCFVGRKSSLVCQFYWTKKRDHFLSWFKNITQPSHFCITCRRCGRELLGQWPRGSATLESHVSLHGRPFIFQDIDAWFFLSSPHPLQCLWIQGEFSTKRYVRDSLCMCQHLYCTLKIIKTPPKGMAQGTGFLLITFTCLRGSSDCPWRKNKPL